MGGIPEDDRVNIKMEDFQEAARSHGITDTREFLKSELFKRAGFHVDAREGGDRIVLL